MISEPKKRQLSNLHGRIARIRQENAEFQRFVVALREDKAMFFDQNDDRPIYAYRMTPDGVIISASPALIRLLGYANIDELRAKSVANGEYDAAYVRELFAQSGGRITRIESAWRRKDGSIVYVRESAAASYDDQGQPIEYEGMIEEIIGADVMALTPQPPLPLRQERGSPAGGETKPTLSLPGVVEQAANEADNRQPTADNGQRKTFETRPLFALPSAKTPRTEEPENREPENQEPETRRQGEEENQEQSPISNLQSGSPERVEGPISKATDNGQRTTNNQQPDAPPHTDSSDQLGSAIRASHPPIKRSAELTPRRYAMSFPADQPVAPSAQIRETLERPALKLYAALLWRWAWLIVLGAMLGGAAAFGVSVQTTPVYQAATSLVVNQARATNSGPDYNALLTGERLAKTYAELMRKRPTLEAVIANLKLGGDAEELAKRVSVSPVVNTQLLVLTVEDSDPQRAADIANEIVKVFGQQNQALQAGQYGDTKQSLERELAKIQLDIDSTQASLAGLKGQGAADATERDRLQTLLAQYRSNYATLLKSLGDVQLAETQSSDNLNVAETARAESLPVRPRTLLNTLLGLIVGAMLAIGMAFLIEYLDDRVKTSEQIGALTGALTLGVIGRIDGLAANGKLVTVRNQQSPLAEAYRMLRVNLDFAAIDRPLRAIAVTSGGPEEGKSTTIANLAVAIAQTGKRVILVDSDLRRPTIHKIFQVSNECGVTTALLNPGDRGLAGQLVNSGVNDLQLLTSGPIPPNPAELLGSQRMAELIEDLKARADLVLFDTPPLLVFADAALLARVCDGTLLVARAQFTRTGALARALEQIDQAGARLLGVVLNRVIAPRGGYQNYYYYYSSRSDKQSRPRGLRGLFGSSRRARKQAASAAELQRLRDGISAIKRTNAALDSTITRASVPGGDQRSTSGGNGRNPHDSGPSATVPTVAVNGADTIASNLLPTTKSQVEQPVSRNGNGTYPKTK